MTTAAPTGSVVTIAPEMFATRTALLTMVDVAEIEALPSIDRLANEALIARARVARIPILFSLRRGALLSGIPEGCRPRPMDMVVEREHASCFSSPLFCKTIEPFRAGMMVFGVTSPEVGLATLVDALDMNLDVRLILGRGAMSTGPAGRLDRDAVHDLVSSAGYTLNRDEWPFASEILTRKAIG